MNTIDNEKSTVTKRDLSTRVRLALKPDIKLHQAQVAEVISQTLGTPRQRNGTFYLHSRYGNIDRVFFSIKCIS